MKNFPDWIFENNSWQEISFDEVITPKARIGWQNLHTDEYLKDGYAYLIGGTDFKNGTVSLENIWQVSKERYEMDSNIQVSAGDVLVTKDGTIGKIATVPELDKPATLNSGVFVFRTNEKLLPKFLHYVLSSEVFEKFIRVTSAGTAVKHLNQKELKNFRFKIPPLSEQKKIADYLTTFDNTIEAQNKKLLSWRELKRGLLQKIFSREWKFTDEQGNFYPDWIEKTLGEVLTVFHGKDYRHLNPGKYPVIGSGGIFAYVDDYNCDWACALIGRKGTIDKPYFMDKPFWCIDTIFYTKAKDGNDPKFQYCLFQAINWVKHSENGNRPSLTKTIVENIEIKIPCVEEQKKIGDYFTELDKIISAEGKILENMRLMKKGLLQKLFV